MKRRFLALALLLAPLAAWPQSFPPTAVLLSNASATGSAVYWPGGIGAFTAVGTFSGTTVTLQYLGPDQTTWVAAGTNATCTAACNSVFYLGEGYIRAQVSGGTPSALYAEARLVQSRN